MSRIPDRLSNKKDSRERRKMVKVDEFPTGEVKVSFSVRDTLWKKLKLTKSWQTVELAVCDEYVQGSPEKADAKGIIIASDGTITRICVDGKEYSDRITGVEFLHRSGTFSPQFEITTNTVDLQGNGNLDDFRKFLRSLMGLNV